MSLFCLLWMPLFYLFWRSVSPDNAASGGVWALILGSVVALVQFFLGNLINPGGFGLSRWISACVDIISLPALLPLIVYFLLTALRLISASADFTNNALLWLIPGAAMRAVNWSAQNDPTHLVLAPLLWTAIGVGIPFFIKLIAEGRWIVILPAILGILALPFAAATAYWAFFSQKFPLGILLLVVTMIPLAASVVSSLIRENG